MTRIAPLAMIAYCSTALFFGFTSAIIFDLIGLSTILVTHVTIGFGVLALASDCIFKD